VIKYFIVVSVSQELHGGLDGEYVFIIKQSLRITVFMYLCTMILNIIADHKLFLSGIKA
jgi:hypothetical protein